jgi:hypothetical protein
MVITAKFAGKCTRCQGQIKAGASIEWAKGQGASHVECPVKVSYVTTTPEGKKICTSHQVPLERFPGAYLACPACEAKRHAEENWDGRCSYRGCRNQATMTTSSGPGCSYHYDDLS